MPYLKRVLSAWLGYLRHPLAVGLTLGVAALAALTGPFGTYHAMPFGTRLVFWGLAVALATGMALLVRAMVETWLERRGTVAVHALTVLGFAFIFTPVLNGLISVFGSQPRPQGLQLHDLFVYVLAISATIAAIRHTIFGAKAGGVPDRTVAIPAATASEAAATTASEPAPRLAARLQDARAGPILRLSGRDHHVDVVTRAGVETLRMRFSDAVAEMDCVDGMTVHRSHWVARSAVVGAADEKGRLFLLTRDGARVPVSRSRRAEVQDAGLV